MQKFNQFMYCAIALGLCACNSNQSTTTPTATTTGWTWMSGSDQSGAAGIYGTLGIASPINVPGARYIAVSWVDASGNFWLFGGTTNSVPGATGNLNDLWKYNPQTNQWTWMNGSNTTDSFGIYGTRGVAASSNAPGARFGAVSWKDSVGDFWLFGGYGYAATGAATALNDLWEYNPQTNQWTWIDGGTEIRALNLPDTPTARLGSTGWTDTQGNLWLFGGSSDIPTLHVFNDLWEYSTQTNTWTNIGGSFSTDTPGIYGTQSTPAQDNFPGARLDSVGWVDTTGNLWLFGGSGVDAAGTRGILNDLWEYSPSANQWTWMSGSNMSGAYGVYGTQGVASTNSVPGSREHRVPLSWTDTNGNFWMFGGDGKGTSTLGALNDLWMYNPANNQWTWMDGNNQSNAFGVYGQSRILAANNVPGGRFDSVGWVDAAGNLWVFGGSGNGISTTGNLNDLWKYTNPNTSPANNPYSNFTCTGINNASPIITGIRGVSGSQSAVYITGIYNTTGGFLYTGSVLGGGNCVPFTYPNPVGTTVTGTSLYGPDNNGNGNVVVVGSYTTAATGAVALGLLYRGAADGSTAAGYTTLNPSSISLRSVINTIAHSTMGGIVVGNYDTDLITGNPFIYNINTGTYYTLTNPTGSASMTAYGIWYNGGTSYTIVGGYSDLTAGGIVIGYITDWDSSTQQTSNFTTLNYNNLPANQAGTHFEGITTDGSGGYNLAADWAYHGQTSTSPAFVHVPRNADGTFGTAAWTAFSYYPGSVDTSANTVYQTYVLGLYQSGNPTANYSYVFNSAQYY